MKGRTRFGATVLLLGALLTAACGGSKYADYASVFGDFKCAVPRGWQVVTERDRSSFANTNFIGPFEPDFLLGEPSLSVRWYADSAAHKLPDGQMELYTGADDYINQTLRDVYQPGMKLVNEGGKIKDVTIDGRPAKYFIVESPQRVPTSLKWGTVIDANTGLPYNVRKHAYTVIPVSQGFYVLIYPATRDGFPLYEKQANKFASSFMILKEGPDGAAAAPAKAGAVFGKK